MRTVGRQVVRIVLTATLGLLASRLGGRGADVSASEIGAASVASLAWNGSVSSHWNTASNWTPALVPTSSDDVAIAATSIRPEAHWEEQADREPHRGPRRRLYRMRALGQREGSHLLGTRTRGLRPDSRGRLRPDHEM